MSAPPRSLGDGRDERGGSRDDRRGQDEVCHLTFEPVSELLRSEAAQPGTEDRGRAPPVERL